MAPLPGKLLPEIQDEPVCQILGCREGQDQKGSYANCTIRRVTLATPRQRQNRRYAINPTFRIIVRGGGATPLRPNELRVRPSASGMKGRLSGEEAGMVRTEGDVY